MSSSSSQFLGNYWNLSHYKFCCLIMSFPLTGLIKSKLYSSLIQFLLQKARIWYKSCNRQIQFIWCLFFLLFFLQIFQQFVGINIVMYYSPIIVQQAELLQANKGLFCCFVQLMLGARLIKNKTIEGVCHQARRSWFTEWLFFPAL